MENASVPPLKEALRRTPVLADLTEDQLEWLAAHVEERTYEAGEVILHEGAAAEHLFVVLEGEIQARPESASGPDVPVYIASSGQVTGLLPHSRMTHYARTSRAVVRVRLAWLHKRHFDEMLQRIPELGPRLLAIMADRIRDTTKSDIQYEKLAALGKLSAGLAHELNNPASAARSSAAALLAALDRWREADRNVLIGPEASAHVVAIEDDAVRHAMACTAMDALTRSDREERLGSALSKLNVPDAWALAPQLTDAGLDEASLRSLADRVGAEAVAPILQRIAALLELYKLGSEIHESTSRVSDLVRAIKEYSWMDTAAEREVDIHEGLETTLTILKHRWKNDIQVDRDYAANLPRICAHGGELNQVWTNLINNAIDALQSAPGEKRLGIRTALQSQVIMVEILDTGHGIPPEIRDHVFEPFFTTKKQSEGTGLGLDLVFRIVRKHKGDIRFESRPGRTCFQVRLPVANARSAGTR
ncbi:MAG TPA: ATP-binding protein [Bryobacteraceae bacterium]|nr:ATP-binding protein [Bryobacteraceae bacterium]